MRGLYEADPCIHSTCLSYNIQNGIVPQVLVRGFSALKWGITYKDDRMKRPGLLVGEGDSLSVITTALQVGRSGA